jgi:hypothetical protein
MLLLVHAAAGATLGAVARRPLPAFALGLASHFLIDAIPHWGISSDPVIWLNVARLDGLLSLLLLAFLAWKVTPQVRVALLAGAFGSMLPDFDKLFLHILGFNPFPAWWESIHVGVQHEMLGYWWVDTLMLSVLLVLLAIALMSGRTHAVAPSQTAPVQITP